MELNVTIIEDNFVHQNLLQKEVEKFLNKNHFFEINTTAVSNFSYYYDELEDTAIQDHDIFFIDIDLNARYTGIDLGEKIRKLNTECYIVYVTAYKTKAIDIINNQIRPWAYLIKQSDSRSFYRELTNKLHGILIDIKKKYSSTDFLDLKIKHTSIRIKTSDILYFEGIKGRRNAVFLIMKNEDIMVTTTLKKLKESLNYPYFYLGLRNYIINTNNIKSWSREDEVLEFINGTQLELGVRLIDKIKKAMIN
ncbi:hypothetical protein UA3_02532 [Enterococcus faecium EnGen0263]|uniref:LytR/AlgR family response regulator transcription factor n=1 Tax=Enterococcus faecium TaxID=1352 RepID=UPI00032D6D43|nr:LytTR family DNA-binding domain-containing protein [Enterococcus faecium]EOH52842.1 hypothetical protein UA3_02532 [Enterococcus faecium EnGen0263]